MKASSHGQIPAISAVHIKLGEAPGARVVDIDCRKPSGTRGSYEYALDYGIVLVRRGGYWREVNGSGAYVGPTEAYFERPFVEQRIEHHTDAGDRCTALWLSESAVFELARGPVPDEPIMTTPGIDLRHRGLVAQLRHGIDAFELDERLAQLVGDLAECASPGRLIARRPVTQEIHRRLVQTAREAIASDPAGADFASLASGLGHSRYHISRVFARATGMTLSQYRNRVRVAIAIDRLADGYENLSMLAADLGFVDQSHFGRVMRAAVGERPSRIRGALSVRTPPPVPRSLAE